MCQVNLFMKEDNSERLLYENITQMETTLNGLRVSTLFEGTSEILNTMIDHIDFSAGKIVIRSCLNRE